MRHASSDGRIFLEVDVSQRTRFLIALIILVGVAGFILGTDYLQRRSVSTASSAQGTPPAGSIPIYLDGKLAGSFTADDLGKLEKVSFADAQEGKTQSGWLLKDILLLYIPANRLQPDTMIVVSSSSRGKSARVSWADADNPDNMVIFDLSNRGTLKLVSKLPGLSTRDEWVQDTDRIEVTSP